MSELLAFVEIGFRHIIGPGAADHVLFLLALSAIYRGRDWKAALWVISAFTVGHSLTLALAVTNTLVLNTSVVEFLIPVTIVATAVENLVWRDRAANGQRARFRPMLAVMFGLVHGAGFAGYLHSMFMDNVLVPLLGFNIGIELGQLVVLASAAAIFWSVDAGIGRVSRPSAVWSPYQLRLVGVSAASALVSAVWAVDRIPR
jgi:hypothetical protein